MTGLALILIYPFGALFLHCVYDVAELACYPRRCHALLREQLVLGAALNIDFQLLKHPLSPSFQGQGCCLKR